MHDSIKTLSSDKSLPRHARLLLPNQLAAAATILHQSGLVVFPTDTVYGVAALATDIIAVAHLYHAKQRPSTMPIPVMLATPRRVPDVAQVQPGFWKLANAFWPGPLTIVLPKRHTLPDIVTAGGETVALRIPAHNLALQLLRLVDAPLAVTSANLSGHAPALTANDALAQLDDRVEAIVDGGPAPGGHPSTIIDLSTASPRIVRPGPISAEQLLAILRK